MSRLEQIIEFLRGVQAVSDKIDIRSSYPPDTERMSVRVGDDCAAIPVDGGYLLLAAEGMLPRFVAGDPWFAGYSAVMVNVSDVCAMGGRPLAVVDVIWSPDHDRSRPLWDGMLTAAGDYGVPIVGGHTTITPDDEDAYLSVSILGRATTLLTSFDARPGDDLLMVVDLDGDYRGDKPFWNASVGKPPSELQAKIALLPQLAERRWCHTAKDISNGGIVGTLIMLLDSSEVGATLDLGALPMPPAANLEGWLISFPSFGYLLTAPPHHRNQVIALFEQAGLVCAVVGAITTQPRLELQLGDKRGVFWELSKGHCQVNANSAGRPPR